MEGITSLQMDTLWVLLGAALVYVMQAGFAMVETGMTRAKNAGNIVMKNMMDFACGTPVFWIIGYGIMYGSMNGFFGGFHFFATGFDDMVGTIPLWCHVAFNTMFCATAATIVSGAMAERTKFKSYLIYSVFISAIIYPIEGHWSWGGGWLSDLTILDWTGFHDYAGSSIVHMTGGICALIGAAMVGPRIGKYTKEGKPVAIPGHSITLACLGVFILWFGWFGFNPASSYGLSTADQAVDVSNVFMTTNLAAAVATVVTMFFTWIRYGKPDVSMTMNGSLAGLVAITAPCSVVDPWAAAIIGFVAGILVVLSVEFFDKVVKIDDPAGAISVHGVNGLWGTLCVGLFARDGGLFTTGQCGRLLVQLVGALATIAFVGLCAFVLFKVIKETIGLRVSPSEEIGGLDLPEHGLASSYAGFVPHFTDEEIEEAKENGVTIPAAGQTVPVTVVTQPAPAEVVGPKFSKVVIVTRQTKFNALKAAMNDIGVTGMTVSNVMGCGIQKGANEYYRGAPLTVNLLPKLKIEIVVTKIPVETVIEAAKRVLYTGHIGDGKIFVYNVENVVKVRTGEEGYDALQSDD
ncbi:MAG: ammonium transporter [Treponema sp.]|nr:ammonium transporter [Treponema sp.]